jgi:hypothetical protein
MKKRDHFCKQFSPFQPYMLPAFSSPFQCQDLEGSFFEFWQAEQAQACDR